MKVFFFDICEWEYLIEKKYVIYMSGDHNEGVHLFPFRTQKLSPLVPMVLFLSGDGRVGSCRAFFIPSCLFLYPYPLYLLMSTELVQSKKTLIF